MKIKTIVSRRAVYFLLILGSTFFSLLLYSTDELLAIDVKFEKNGLSSIGADVIQTKNRSFLIAGRLYDESASNWWGWLGKVDINGKVEWEKELGKKAQNSSFAAVANVCHGQVAIAGNVHGHYEFGSERSSSWVVKTDQDGRILWDKAITSGQSSYAVDVKPSAEGDILVLVASKQGSKNFISILKFDCAGNEILRKEISHVDSLVGKFIYPLLDKTFIVVGTRFSAPNFQSEVWAAHFGEAGDLLWEKTFRDEQGRISAGVILSDKSVLLAKRGGVLGEKLSFAMVDSNGSILWNEKNSDPNICNISELWLSPKGKVLAVVNDCDPTNPRIWVGEVLAKGKVNRFMNLAPMTNGLRIVRALSTDQKIAVMLEDKTSSEDVRTRLFITSIKDIE